MKTHRFFVTTARNLEPLLFAELVALGVDARETRGGVLCSGSLDDAYRCCLWSRFGSRVLLELACLHAPPAASGSAERAVIDAETLYVEGRELSWEDWFDAGASFAVQVRARRSHVDHTHFAALRVKDAIVDRFRESRGARPDVDTDRPDARFVVHVDRDTATVYFDLAGEALHRRGLRVEGVVAPLREDLAAAVLLRAGWPEIAARGGALVDPMCGSGTFLLEGALQALHAAPGQFREHWGMYGYSGHDAACWDALRGEARAGFATALDGLPPMCGFDSDAKAVAAARMNLERAGFGERITVEQRDIARAAPPANVPAMTAEGSQPPGLVIVNPPYGERLRPEETLEVVHARLGAVLMENFPAWHCGLLSAWPDAQRAVGLRWQRRHAFVSGTLETTLWVIDVAQAVQQACDEDDPDAFSPGARSVYNRLLKNLRVRERWARKAGVDAYRVYDADLPEYAFAVDRYLEAGAPRDDPAGWHVHVAEYQAPASVDRARVATRRSEALRAIRAALGVPRERLYLKTRAQQKGASQYRRAQNDGDWFVVAERGARVIVNFEAYLDTGLFLDHRQVRRWLAEWLQERSARQPSRTRFLNLFAYTGVATVHAALAGAVRTTSVDLSKTYLRWAADNLVENGLHPDERLLGRGVVREVDFDPDRPHQLVPVDARTWLADADERGERFDLIFVDPPTFSASKKTPDTFDVQRDHASLLRAAMRLLEPDGLLVFSNNLRRFRLDTELEQDFRVEDRTRASIPEDFARTPRIHGCWFLRHGD